MGHRVIHNWQYDKNWSDITQFQNNNKYSNTWRLRKRNFTYTYVTLVIDIVVPNRGFYYFKHLYLYYPLETEDFHGSKLLVKICWKEGDCIYNLQYSTLITQLNLASSTHKHTDEAYSADTTL